MTHGVMTSLGERGKGRVCLGSQTPLLSTTSLAYFKVM